IELDGVERRIDTAGGERTTGEHPAVEAPRLLHLQNARLDDAPSLADLQAAGRRGKNPAGRRRIWTLWRNPHGAERRERSIQSTDRDLHRRRAGVGAEGVQPAQGRRDHARLESAASPAWSARRMGAGEPAVLSADAAGEPAARP